MLMVEFLGFFALGEEVPDEDEPQAEPSDGEGGNVMCI